MSTQSGKRLRRPSVRLTDPANDADLELASHRAARDAGSCATTPATSTRNGSVTCEDDEDDDANLSSTTTSGGPQRKKRKTAKANGACFSSFNISELDLAYSLHHRPCDQQLSIGHPR